MAGTTRGRNNGITGTLIDLPGQGAKFSIRCSAFADKLATTQKPRAGRGTTTTWPTSRALLSTGSIVVRGKLQLDGWPAPNAWRGETGSIVLQYHSGYTKTVPVIVESSEHATSDETYDVVLALRITGQPVWAGWEGTQPAAGTASASDQEQWQGSGKVHDPNGLQSNALTRFDVWGSLLDTDVAELARIATVIAAAAQPMTGQKVRTATFNRDSVDGGEVVIAWGLTDTAEDVVNPRTSTKTDPSGLASSATAAGINATPATVSGFVDRGVTVSELNDAKELRVKEMGLRSTEADITYPGSPTEYEWSNIGNKARATQVTTSSTTPATPTAPANMQAVGSGVVRENDGKWVHWFLFGNSTAEEEIEYATSRTTVDPDSLEDDKVVTDVTASSTPPATPTASGLKFRRRDSRRIQTTPEKWEHRFTLARTTTEEDVENPGTFTDVDPDDLRSTGRQTSVYDPGGAFPTISVPAGQQLVETHVEEIHDSRNVARFRFAKDTSSQEEEQRRTRTVEDPADVQGEATRAAVDGTPSAPGGQFVLRTERVEPLTHDHDVTVREYGLRDTVDDVEMPASEANLDPLGIDSFQRERVVYTTVDGVPSAPAAASGELQLVYTSTQQINRVVSHADFRFDVLNSEQKRTYPKTSTTEDGTYNLEDEAMRAEFWDAGDTPPALPTDAPTNNVKLITFTDVPVTPLRNLRVWLYGPRNTRDRLVLPNHETRADPDNVESTAIRAGLNGETITDPVGYVLRRTRTMPVTDGLGVNRTLTVREYGLRTTAEDVTMPGTFTETDPLGLESRGRITQVFDTGLGVPADPTPPAGLQQVTSTTRELNQVVSEAVWTYDVNNSVQKVEFRETRETVDPNGIDSAKREGEVYTNGAPPSFPASPSGLKAVSYLDVPLTPTRSVRVFQHGVRDSVDDAVLPRTFTLADPSNIASNGSVAAFNATPTVPAGYQARGTRGIYLTPTDLVNVTEFGLNSHADDVLNRANVGAWDQDDGERSTEATIITSATDVLDLAEANATANSANLYFGGNRFTRLTPDLVLQEIRYRSSDKVVEFERSYLSERWSRAGTGTNVALFLADLVKRGTNLWHYRLARVPYPGATMHFGVFRRVAAGSLNLLDTLAGKANNAAFLGLAAGTVSYMGPAGRALIDGSGNGVNIATIGARFYWDSNGHVDPKKAREGWNMTTTDLTSLASLTGTWVNAYQLGLDSILMPQVSFAGALA